MAGMYLTYEEYAGYYGGTLPKEEFAMAEFRARKRIDYLTDSRVAAMAAVPEAVKLCMVQIIAVDSKFGPEAQVNSPVVASYNTDGYSESYGGVEAQMEAATRSVDAAIREMLYGEEDDRGVPLLYRGLDL